MPSNYHKMIFRLEAGELADYSALEDIFEEYKEFPAVSLNRREHDSINVPVLAAPVTIAIGTETVVGLYVRNTGAQTIIVKWTQNTVANEQMIGEASPTGEWMFVPKVDSSTNITLETNHAVNTSTARVLIIHN